MHPQTTSKPPVYPDQPIFVGLSHIGQVFSLGWALKVGPCAVFDFETSRREAIAASELTEEEPGLRARWAMGRDRIQLYSGAEKITDHRVVFLTIDTPLNQQGEPNVEVIRAFIEQCVPYLAHGATLILLSQVYPGFCDEIKRDLLSDRPDVRLVYMVDTLKMGKALERFLEPEQLIFGVERAQDVPEAFQKYFSCPIHTYTWIEAEMVKVAINIYLFFSVTFANAMDNYCRQLGFRFAPLAASLRHDVRIGKDAYIAPSLGVSGGHLERDMTTILRKCQDAQTRRLFEDMKALNADRMRALYDAVGACSGLRSILWVGVSYKRESFSLVNSPFMKFVDRFVKELNVQAYDSFYPLPALDGVTSVRSLSQALDHVDGVVLNYAQEADVDTVRRALQARKDLAGFDISLPAVFAKASAPCPANMRHVF